MQTFNMNKDRPTGHPGAYVRESVIPRSLDWKGVAKIMSVRYSTLRSFLNCETALSPDLAERLELHWRKANRQELLDMQARYDAKAASATKS
jgi:plasmid maintenance system antidote protein VapI